MILPKNHITAYNGDMCNWCVGDAAYDIDTGAWDGITFWCFGIPQNTSGGKWNSINSKYCGKFNDKTREVSEIIERKTK